jgi:tetratricopeptide (TPR) repeat protein
MVDPTHTADEPDVLHGTASLADTGTATVAPRGLAVPSAPPTPGTRYVLGEEIASGGMGKVYRATDTVLNREVAVKVLQDKYAPTSGAARRFADEARITGQLQHPAIPPVHDLGTLPDGRPFLAMKLIKGETLDDVLKARLDPRAERGRYVAAFEAVCQGVAYAHAHGVIHRDLKPQNMMVGRFGEVQVMDWGLAKVLGTRPAAETDPESTSVETEINSLRDSENLPTQAGSVLGTPAYLPPEQAIGAVDQIDRRSDVFGLGGILAAVLTGRPPFVGDSAESTRQLAAKGKIRDCFDRLDASGADPELVALCKRCLAPERDDRPADAGAVAKAVAALRTAADERARQAELDRVRADGERAKAEAETREQRKRRRVQAALGLTVTALVALGGGVAWWRDRQEAAERDRRDRNAEAVAVLLARCEEALEAGDADRAAVALEAAEKRADDTAASDHAERLARLRADLTLSRDLDEVDRFRWTVVAGGRVPRGVAVAERYQSALGRYGADPTAVPAGRVAGRVRESSVRDRLVSALDRWLREAPSDDIRAALHAADPHPFRDLFRDLVRDAGQAGNNAEVAKLAEQAEVEQQPAGFLAVLGESPEVPVGRRRGLLQIALRQRPRDMAVLMALGKSYPMNQATGAAERVRWFQATVAVAPENPAAHSNLGLALHDAGDLAGAMAEFREALRLDSKYAMAHNNLGWALQAKGDRVGAIAEYREAIHLDPKSTIARTNLGRALYDGGDVEGGLAQVRTAIARDDQEPASHFSLGLILWDRKDRAGAIDAYRKSVSLDPDNTPRRIHLAIALGQNGDPNGAIDECSQALDRDKHSSDKQKSAAHCNLGVWLGATGEPHKAVTAYREAVRLDANNTIAHANLGITLMGLEDFAGAEDALRTAIHLDPKHAGYRVNLGYALFQQGMFDAATVAVERALQVEPDLREAKQLQSQFARLRGVLLPRLPGVVAGTDKPASRAEVYEFAELCWQPYRKWYASAVVLYERTFADDPALAANLPHRARYFAACCAVLAAGGAGVNPPTDSTERATLRVKALVWLRTDLQARKRQAQSSSRLERQNAVDNLYHWLTDPDMARARPGLMRIGMPADEREKWDALWADVRATLAEARKPPPPPEVAPPPHQPN